jgi:UDP-N-acetylglucosamine acyltransferase
MKIHQTAIIEDGAILGDNVEIGAYCFISRDSIIGDNTSIAQSSCIYGKTTIGKNNRIFSHSVLGSIPQDLKFDGEDVSLIIGDNNTIREFTLFNPGTKGGGGVTKIGNNNLFMGYVHIAHDCIIGDRCILANGATLAGHIEMGDFAVVGGLTPIHQFVHIGDFAMIGGASAVSQDIPPYCLAEGNRAILRGLNLTGLRRHIEDRKEIDNIKYAYKELFTKNRIPKDEAINFVDNDSIYVKKLAEFVINSKRGIPLKKENKKNDES